jgi:hypothetical protein
MVPVTRSVKVQVDKLIDEAKGGKMPAVRKILAILEEHNLLYRLRVPPRLVIVHRKNRDGLGLQVQDVHELADDIVDCSFDSEETYPVAAEVEEADKDFNIELFQHAKGLLGSIDSVAEAIIASLSNSHTSFVTRVVSEEVPHAGNQKICKDGHFSMAVCKTESPELHDVSITGMEWRVIRKPALDTWPELPGLIQESKNTNIERGEHDLQLLRRCQNLVAAQVQRGERPDLEKVKRAALRSKPKCAASLQLALVMIVFMLVMTCVIDASNNKP